MTYRDMAFCPFHKDCTASPDNGGDCERVLTERVKNNARFWWGEE